MDKGNSRKDVNQLAKYIVDKATGNDKSSALPSKKKFKKKIGISKKSKH